MSDDADNWHPFDGGRSIGIVGSEDGTILADDEHADGARITLERHGRAAPFAITCGIYGWMLHTRFFRREEDACAAYAAMKQALDTIILAIPLETDPDRDARMKETSRRIGEFVQRFP
jgi:hypothetical protein